VQHVAEVLEPDVRAVAMNQIEEIEVLERDPDEVVDRVREDRAEYENNR
jgi:hypothetical protein